MEMKDVAKDLRQENYLRAMGMCMFISTETGVDIPLDSTVGAFLQNQLSEAQGEALDKVVQIIDSKVEGGRA